MIAKKGDDFSTTVLRLNPERVEQPVERYSISPSIDDVACLHERRGPAYPVAPVVDERRGA